MFRCGKEYGIRRVADDLFQIQPDQPLVVQVVPPAGLLEDLVFEGAGPGADGVGVQQQQAFGVGCGGGGGGRRRGAPGIAADQCQQGAFIIFYLGKGRRQWQYLDPVTQAAQAFAQQQGTVLSGQYQIRLQLNYLLKSTVVGWPEIGRASCRERV